MNGQRLRDVSSPESIAATLVALLAVVVIATSALAAKGEQTRPVQSASPTASRSAPPTMDPAIQNALATALVVNQSLAARAVALEAAIAVDAPLAPDIAAILRSVNGDLNAGNEAADQLLIADDTARLGADLGAFYDAVMARNNETLGTTIRNVDAYVAGARAIIDLLAQLPPLNDRIADALARRPDASVAPTPGPTSVTPSPAAPSPSQSAPPASPTATPPASPPPSGATPGLLPNGGFEDGLTGWRLLLSDGTQASLTLEPGAGPDGSAAARVDIGVGSQARAGISLTTSGLALSQGVTYVVEVSVRSSAVREIRARLTDSAGQNTVSRVFQVGTTWTVISFDTIQFVTDPSVELGLDLGRSEATVWFDNVIVRESPG